MLHARERIQMGLMDGVDHLSGVLRGMIWNRRSQPEWIISIHKQNALLNKVLMANGMYHRRGMRLLPWGVIFKFLIWLKQYSADNLNYFYIMTQFWHVFAPFFIFWMIRYSLLTNECPELSGLFWKLICTYHIHVIGNTVTSCISNV